MTGTLRNASTAGSRGECDHTVANSTLNYSATGHRCANGSLGARTVTLNGLSFTGNAVQVYTLSP